MYIDKDTMFTLHDEKKNLEKIISERNYDFFFQKRESTKKKIFSKYFFLFLNLTFILRLRNPLP